MWRKIVCGLVVGMLLDLGTSGWAQEEEAAKAASEEAVDAEFPAAMQAWERLAEQRDSLSQRESVEREREVLSKHPILVRWLGAVATQHYQQGDYARAAELFVPTVEASRRMVGPEHPDTLILLNNLAATLQAQGDLSGARELQEEVLSTRRRVFGPEHPDTLTSMNNLVSNLIGQGDLSGARELQEAALSIGRRVLGSEHSDTLTALNNLAGILKAQGDLVALRVLAEEVLSDRRRLQGLDHPDTLTAMNNLAGTLKAQGDLAAAQQLQEEIVSIQRETLGSEHPKTLEAMNNLAGILHAQGNLVAPQKLLGEVLSVRRRVLGLEHLDTLRAMNNLSGILYTQGNLAEARQLQEEILSVRRLKLGPKHPDTLMAMSNLAATLHAQGDFEGARQLQGEALLSLRRRLGSEHPDTLIAADNLASTLRSQGDLAKAQGLQEETLVTSRRILGPDHPDTLTVLSNLALTLKDRGDYTGALQLQEEALSVRHRVLGPEHPDTVTAMNNFAVTLHAQGDLAAARQLEEEALSICRRVLGQEHPNTLAVMNSLATTLTAQGDLVRVQKLQEHVLSVARQSLGPKHRDTLTALSNLAETLVNRRNLAGGLQLLQEALSIRRRVLGPEHIDTLTSINNLARVMALQKRLSNARELHQEALSIRLRVLGAEHPDTLQSMSNLAATLYEEGNLAEARQLFEEIGAIHARLAGPGHQPNTFAETVAFHFLGIIHRDSQDLVDASTFFFRALDALKAQTNRAAVSEDTKTFFRAQYGQMYRDAISVSVALKRLEAGFYALERYRAQSLLTMLIQRRLTSESPSLALAAQRSEIAARYDATYRELAYLEREAAETDSKDKEAAERAADLRNEQYDFHRKREVLEAKIRTTLFGDTHLSLKPIKIAEVREALDQGTLLLSYSVGEEMTTLFVLSRSDGLKAHSLSVSRDTLRKQLVNFSLQLQSDVCSGPSEASILMGQWFYEKLLDPATRSIATHKRLLILPDGPLHYLPFAALSVTTERGRQYLVEWKPLHIAASAAVYAELRSQRVSQRSGRPIAVQELVAFGDPTYPDEKTKEHLKDPCKNSQAPEGRTEARRDSTVVPAIPLAVRSAVSRGIFDGLDRLPYSGREVREISRLFPLGTTQTYLRQAASEERAKAEIGKARIVHFAVHGLLDADKPTDSFLALTLPTLSETSRDAGYEDNGILQAWELGDVRLNADLVVLSACQTALGPRRGGEGLLSLSRAFQIAGARTVMASLWSVNDASTAELMIRFYRHLLAGKSKDQALRHAQLELIRGPIETIDAEGHPVIRNFSSPYHWAAFQIIGDWQ